MSEIEQFIALYDLQGVQFWDWMRSYWETAYYLEKIRIAVGKKNVLAYLKSNCPGVDIELCEDLLLKLDNTKPGAIIRAQVETGIGFTLPK